MVGNTKRAYAKGDTEAPLNEHPALKLIHWQASHCEGRVGARELYKRLGISRDFNSWLSDYIETLPLRAGKDFARVDSSNSTGQHIYDYLLSEYAALEIVMSGRGDLARFVRRSILRRDGQVAVVSHQGINVNMREVKALPVPERSTSKPYSGTNYTENIE